MKFKNIFVALFAASVSVIALSACTAKQSSVADYESSQMAAKKHCQSNGDDYIAQAGMTGVKFVFDTDSSIDRYNLQGDGWCSSVFIENGVPDNSKKIWCRSKPGQGCKTTKPAEDGKANPNLDQSTPIQK